MRVYAGQLYVAPTCRMAAFNHSMTQSRLTAAVESFGCRQAPESPRRTNPRATGLVLWVFLDLAGLGAARRG